MQDMSSLSFGHDVYSIWHYLHGWYIPESKLYTKVLSRYGSEMGKTNKLCTNQESCQDIEGLFESLDEYSLNKLKDLTDQPKGYSDGLDFSIVKLCSFGSEQLEKCEGLQRSKYLYQDNTCYTIDKGLGAKPFAPNGLNLLLDLKHMPSDGELPLKLFFHEHGTIPDVLRLESSVQIIKGKGNSKIGLSLQSNEITENFAKMPFKKRNCLIPEEMTNYSKVPCLVDQLHTFAQSKCQCLPILMGGSLTNGNVKCSTCFREAVHEAKSMLNESLCPSPCVNRNFKPSVSWEPWNEEKLEYGTGLVSFLFNNPLYQVLDDLQLNVSQIQTPLGGQGYLDRNSENLAYIEIFFKDPQKTVIVQDAKVTETDMVSNIGGTIGIFLGLSTISCLDMIIEWFTMLYEKHFDKPKSSIRKTRSI